MPHTPVLLLHPDDDVAVALASLPPGARVSAGIHAVVTRQAVPAGHKVAVRPIAVGGAVGKYGCPIGVASEPIEPGDWVHTHNVHVGPLAQAYEYGTDLRAPRPLEPGEERTFMGYRRADGRVGTRNYVALVAASNCAADTARMIAEMLNREAVPDFAHVDGALAVTHPLGCGMALGGTEHRLLQRCLAGLASHPNVGATILVGLGCEVNQAEEMARAQALIAPQALAKGVAGPPPVLTIQRQGGVRRTVEAGFRQAVRLLRQLDTARRTPQPLSSLTVGTNCGGSDGHSGITANPALGAAGDLLVRHGAAWVLAETPETYGAEHLLTRRAVSRDVGERLVALMRWWEQYTALHGAEIDNNPAPGNKEGGLTTIYEKSLGAMTKGGTTPLNAVLAYGERVTARGLSFMDTPGHDPTSVTGLVAGGCNLVAFTTGRGSCLGFRGVPVLKVAATTDLYERMQEDMDFDSGAILHGTTVLEMGVRLADAIIATASGKLTCSEMQGLGDHTFTPWQLGPVL